MKFNVHNVDRMVTEQKSLDNDVEWDGWNLVFYRPAEHAMHSVNGAWRNGQYAFKNIVPLADDGTWNIDPRNLKRVNS